ncbi:MAG: aldose epimerase family protein [Bacteroidota bacterium]
MRIQRTVFGELTYGTAYLFRLTNSSGMEVEITNYGGIIKSIRVPDRVGELTDVVLGFDTLDGYLGDHPYFGALVGRYCNRIAQGRFSIDGQEYQLATNNGPNHLHGGVAGFSHKLWKAETFKSDKQLGIDLKYISLDSEAAYPGNLEVTARYTLMDDNILSIDYEATTDKPTVINLTNHSYFNLAGQGDVLDHELMICADTFTPVNASLIPTGEYRSVADTPFDFRSFTPIGLRIGSRTEQMVLGGGYDHNFVLDRQTESDLELAASLYDPTSGRTLDVLTTEPGMQLFTTNFENSHLIGKGGQPIPKHGAVCLETQHFPDSPNQSAFPTTTLRPGEVYRSRTDFRFGLSV